MLPKRKRMRTIRTEIQSIQWLRKMGYHVHPDEWGDAVIVVNPATNASRQFESAVLAQAYLLEQANVYQQNRVAQNVIEGGTA